MICIIGNAPSSGSTLLADLLDSTPHSVCGPELNLFSNRRIYDFRKYKRSIRQTSLSPSIHRLRNGVNLGRLHSYGLSLSDFTAMAQRSADVTEFAEAIAKHFIALRGKHAGAVFFEKTPENISCIGQFLDHFAEGYFLHMVRNPLYIYPSLLRRGFPRYVCLLTWLLDVAQYHKYRNHERVIPIKYEELVAAPYQTVAGIIQRIAGKEVSEEIIRREYETNRYRMVQSKKIATWTVTQYGVIQNANNREIPRSNLFEESKLLNVKVTAEYAELFGLAELSFMDALEEFGYKEQVLVELSKVELSPRIPAKSRADYMRLTYKWFQDFRHGDARVSDLGRYLTPVERA